MRQKNFPRLNLICLSFLLIGFCFPFPHGSQAAQTPDILRIGLNMKGVDTLDPHFANEPDERALAEMLFNRLIRYKPGTDSEPEADLALDIPEPEIVSGRQVWTFRLRKGVMFHPGPETEAYELTADDVIASFRKAIYSVSSIYAGDYSGITVERIGLHVMQIICEKPISKPLFMAKLAAYPGGFIVSRLAVRPMGYEQFKTHPVGTGPFMFDHSVPGRKLGFRANMQYFRESPALGGVDIFFMPDIEKRKSYLRSGKLDIIDGKTDSKWAWDMMQAGDIVTDLQGIGEAVMIHFNTSESPLHDERIRRAIAYALDRKAFLDICGPPVARNIYSPVPETLLTGGLEGKKIDKFGLDYPTNPDKAKQLMDKAGYPDGFSLTLVVSKRHIYRRYYEVLKDQLAQIGIECELKTVAHSSMHTRIRQGENPIVIYIAWRPDADAVLTRFFHSDSIIMKGGNPDTNFSCYQKADKLIEAARSETDPGEQVRLWEYAQLKILDHMVVYPLQYISPVHARRSVVDYGHVPAQMEIYPRITEQTKLNRAP